MIMENFKRIKGITLKGLLIVIFCGAIFGYGTGVISNVANSFFVANPGDKNDFSTSFVTASAILGAFFGSLISGFLADRIGRKKTLLIGAFVSLLGNIIAMLAFDSFYILGVGRFIWGLSLGILSSAAPLYLSETTSCDMRGFLGVFFQFSITFTIFLGSLWAYAVTMPNAWRVMLGLLFLPNVMLIIIIFFAPPSPRYLADKDRHRAEALFDQIYPNETERVKEEIDGIIASKAQQSSWGEVFSHHNSRALMIGIVLCIAQQWTGINAIIYYFITLAQLLFGANATNTATAFAGVMLWNCVTSMGAIPLTSKLSRRTLMLVGQLIMFVSLAITGAAFFFTGNVLTVMALIGICSFILGFEISVGPLFFVIINEIFPECHRGLIGSVMTGIQWFCNFVLTVTFPFLINAISPPTGDPNGYVFFIFMAVGIVTWVYQLFCLPETHNKNFKEIQDALHKKTEPVQA